MIELGRWPNLQAGVAKWLANYPEHKPYETLLPVMEPRAFEENAA